MKLRSVLIYGAPTIGWGALLAGAVWYVATGANMLPGDEGGRWVALISINIAVSIPAIIRQIP